MSCIITTAQLINLSREALRRHDPLVEFKVGQTIAYRLQSEFVPYSLQTLMALRRGIIEAIHGNIVTLRVLINLEVVTPGRLA